MSKAELITSRSGDRVRYFNATDIEIQREGMYVQREGRGWMYIGREGWIKERRGGMENGKEGRDGCTERGQGRGHSLAFYIFLASITSFSLRRRYIVNAFDFHVVAK